jgi:hypothetical protein
MAVTTMQNFLRRTKVIIVHNMFCSYTVPMWRPEIDNAGHEWPYSDPGNATDDSHLLDFLKNISTST